MTEIVLGSLLFTVIVVGLGGLVMGARSVLLPSREVTITVNGTREVQGRTGQKLLQVLDQAGIALPSACGGAGTCGLCRATIEDGATEPLPTEVNRLTRREVMEGMRLACQVVLRGDMAVGVPEGVLEAETLEATVTANRSIAPLIKELVLDLPPDAEMEAPAGSFMQLTAPPFDLDFTRFEIDERFEGIWQHLDLRELSVSSAVPVTRAYSIANRPQDRGGLVFNIRLALPPPHQDVPPGIVSSYLFGLKPGDRITVAGPYGNFRAQETDREMVFIGGGVGMAPLRAIIFD
ncbi:MAG TPA: NADH:ubiquinone reductase (Na(+)-transporting) subunit F, partial [Alphaproteobacteria bacterium]|nr:NADH:ubiquinone reductase (Na(+)-transporting) subunit F [Alphaproteobacteria bacterium]